MENQEINQSLETATQIAKAIAEQTAAPSELYVRQPQAQEAQAQQVAPQEPANAEPQSQEPQKQEVNEASIRQRAIEDVASRLGWKPREQYYGENWVDPETYILKSKEIQATQYENNRELKRQLNEMKSSIDGVRAFYEADFKAKLEKEISSLKAERSAAIAVGNEEEVERIEAKIELAKNKAPKVAAPPPPPPPPQNQQAQPHPVVAYWITNNDWYSKDAEMRAFADQVTSETTKARPDASIPDVLKAVEEKVTQKYPDKVSAALRATYIKQAPASTPQQPAHQTVEGSGNRPLPGQRKYSVNDLSPLQRQVMESIVRSTPAMTPERYIQSLVNQGVLA